MLQFSYATWSTSCIPLSWRSIFHFICQFTCTGNASNTTILQTEQFVFYSYGIKWHYAKNTSNSQWPPVRTEWVISHSESYFEPWGRFWDYHHTIHTDLQFGWNRSRIDSCSYPMNIRRSKLCCQMAFESVSTQRTVEPHRLRLRDNCTSCTDSSPISWFEYHTPAH